SVLSALEGIEVVAPKMHPMILPLTILILAGLFAIQKRGTEHIGKIFGPFMVLWFGFLAIMGIRGILMNPMVLKACMPPHAASLFLNYPKETFFTLSGV